MDRPYTTLFMLMSVDGKISSGDTDELDSDRDWRRVVGVREGLHQYYELEQKTELFSLNSGKVMAKIGANERGTPPAKVPVTFVIIDSKPHLTLRGVKYMLKWGERLILATDNPEHPAVSAANDLEGVRTVVFDGAVDLPLLLSKLKSDFKAERLTIQSGGSLNAAFLRLGLVDRLSVVVSPILVGGRSTPTLIDGESLHTVEDLHHLRALKLLSCKVMNDSYIHLEYDVFPATLVDEFLE